jgi:DNA-binding MarR family transcriptional regulator
MQYVRTFMLVCVEPGLGVMECANRAGVSQTVMSRHLLDIGDRNRYMEPVFGLVTKRQDPMNLRRWEVHLTEKGRQVAHKIIRVADGGVGLASPAHLKVWSAQSVLSTITDRLVRG